MNTLRQLSARIARQCAVAVACAFNAVCGMQRCCAPLPPRIIEIKCALRRIGILAVFAVCILTFAAPDAQAQTSCEAGERAIKHRDIDIYICLPDAAADIADNCIAAEWGVSWFGAEVGCAINSRLHNLTAWITSSECYFHGTERIPSCADMYGDPPQFPKKADFPDIGDRVFVANCSRGGTISGAIPATINTIGATECTCDRDSGYAGTWPNCIACENGEGVLANGTCGVCPELIENGICVACPLVGQVVVGNACVCPDNHTPFGGICIPDSPRDFGELSDAVLCEVFGGEVLNESLSPEAEQLKRGVEGEAGAVPAPSPAIISVLVAMTNAIQAKFRGDIVAVNAFLSRYDTGGADYNADAYIRIVFRANLAYGARTFLDGNSNELARILSRVPVQGPDKCVGANNSDALCVLDDEADSAGVLPCEGQFPRLWACHNAGWSFSVNNGGSCGVLLTLAGGTTSDQCHLSGSASPLCDDVFGADVDFPAPTLSTDGATLRFVYNCDPDGSKGLIPATTNTIAATECATCPGGRVVVNGECVCPTGAIVIQGVCTCPDGQGFLGNVCIPEEGDFGLSDELLCGAFGGTVQTATGGREVCSGMDANDTFCIMDSAVGFPCRGLFKHLRSCNVEFNRKALNPFFCGEKCGVQKAVGSECR